jgi:uncharacterized membrane protein YhaH (DUF805 family)
MPETCPYCRGVIDECDAVRCPSCATPHHQDCFTENAGCTVFGCESAPPESPKIEVTLADTRTTALPSPVSVEPRFDRCLYFVHRDGQQFGPYSLRQLHQYADEKRILATDLAWSEGMPEWVFVSDVLGDLADPTSRRSTSAAAAPRTFAAASPHVAATSDALPDRIHFGRGLYLLSTIGLVLVNGVLSSSKETQGLGALILIVGWVAVTVLRVLDMGMSGWAFLLAIVPLVNVVIYFLLFCAPRGYYITKKSDTYMKVMGWSLGALVVLGILIAISSPGSH